MNQGHIFHKKIKLCSKSLPLVLMLILTCLIFLITSKHQHKTRTSRKRWYKLCLTSLAPVFHISVLLGSSVAPWLESACRILQSLGGSSQLCPCFQCKRSSSFLPSVCAQRMQLKPEWDWRRSECGLGHAGPWGTSPGLLGLSWAPSCFVSISLSFCWCR